MLRHRMSAVLAVLLAVATFGAVGSAGANDAPALTPDGAVTVSSVVDVPTANIGSTKRLPVVIRLELQSVADYDGSIAGFEATSPLVTGEAIDANSASVRSYRGLVADEAARVGDVLESSIAGAEALRSIDIAFAGITALVPADQIAAVASLPGVADVFVDRLEQLDTETSTAFIGADDHWRRQGGLGAGGGGEGVVVGVLDSGVWPEHPSFADPDPAGVPFTEPPTVPGSNGFSAGERSTCDFGDAEANADDAAFSCNNKLIGAYEFMDTYKAVVGLEDGEFDSARDDDGHGTHTASTAVGNAGVDATIFGVDRGTVSGVAPRAHLVAYRVCGAAGCFGSDSVDAVGQAILDGVDVVNFSISGGGNPYADAVSLAFLDAYDAGVLVTPSAGNSGPGADTVAHREPWTLTVGASTSDRHFLSTVTLTADGGATLELTGASVTEGITEPTPVVFGVDLDCLEPDEQGSYDGEIVVCRRGAIARVAKGFNVLAGGAGAMLLFNPTPQGLSTDNHFLPAVHLENDAGEELVAFLDANTGVMATFTPGQAVEVPGDVMAPFSSRGGSGQTLGISKPDVTAPGVQILAGHTPLPVGVGGGRSGELFQAIQGTSMSAPHAAGAAALLAGSQPEWGPGQIKSALMMSADRRVENADGSAATPFDTGSGSIRPSWADQVGFTISAEAGDFVSLEDELWDANYPSLYVPNLAGSISVSRTLTDVSGVDSTWSVAVEAPADLQLQVTPRPVEIAAGGDTEVSFFIDAREVPFGESRHAEVLFRNRESGQLLSFPVTIVRQFESLEMDVSCEDGAVVMRNAPTTCTTTVVNRSFEAIEAGVNTLLPSQLGLDPDSVSYTTSPDSSASVDVSNRGVKSEVTLAGEQPPSVSIAADPEGSPAGFLPLADLGVAAEAPYGDETIVNYTVPDFVYAGQTYNRIGVVSNGYAVVGGGEGSDVEFINTDLPDPSQPNNVLAPFWTDLNPENGGDIFIGVLRGGDLRWLVIEWSAIQNFGDGEANSFQIWIGLNGEQDVTFTYGDVSDGDGGFLTVGAENDSGTSGATTYFDGAGTAPAAGDELRVGAIPGQSGGVLEITYDVIGRRWGPFQLSGVASSAALASDVTDTVSGRVVNPTRVISVALDAGQEVPPADSAGTGTAELRLNRWRGVVCLDLAAMDLEGDVVAGHIHAGEAGVNGPVVVNLEVDSATFDDCVVGVPTDVVDAILANPAAYYLNIHTPAVPSGEIRGQLG